MDERRHFFAVLTLALAAPFSAAAHAQVVTTYFESSGTVQAPHGNAGLAVQSDRLQLSADLALRATRTATPTFSLHRRPAGSTDVVPNLRSTFSIATNLGVETRLRFAEWNAGGGTAVDTRLRYRRALDGILDEVDGSLWRLASGSTKQTLRLRIRQVLRNAGAPAALTIAGEATFEATTRSDVATLPGVSAGSRKVGAETRLAGLTSPFLATQSTLSLKVEKTVGAREESASALAYDQSWVLSPLTTLGLNLSFLRKTYSPADDFEPSIHFSWRGAL